MDFSSFNSAEQAHMTKVIEKKQVSFVAQSKLSKQVTYRTGPHVDARLFEDVREPSGKVFHVVLQ